MKRSREESASIHEAHGIRLWAGRKWEKLVRRFGQDVSGTRRFKIFDPQSMDLEDRRISNEFAQFIQRKFEKAVRRDLLGREKWSNRITKKEVKMDDDLVDPDAKTNGRTGSDGPRLDGAMNRHRDGVDGPVRLKKLVRDVRCHS